MIKESADQLIQRITELENRLAESEQLIDAIRAGEVDAFAISANDRPEVYTLQSGDYAYRVLIEEFGEGAVNVTEDGIIVYTNAYFCELVGLPYEKVIGSFISDLIHPDSQTAFTRCFREALSGKCKGEVNLSVNGKYIPVYVSLTTLQPNLATVGIVISDLTETKKNEAVILQYQKDLEAKNLELLQSNTELASFAYLASHDLQEPLRKIRIFCGRILEKDADKFSQATKDYFHRIMGASDRMQNLIIALLNYSRISTSEILLTESSLGRIAEEVRSDLNELIQEANATIEICPLPDLKVIPLQFSQLFSNLIMNSLKYRKAGTKPVIKISAEMVQAGEIAEEGSFRDGQYWKIEFRDNGIGFDQKYADRIFELFQRLHGKSEYEGTGIGLAICKKIVQNHNGFISASGQPGAGAVFNIYLPQN
jgi:PAS domain S-box-containing protein